MQSKDVVVGHTLVDASSRSGSVLMVNPNAEVVVLPSFTCIGKLVPLAAISVALADPGSPNDGPAAFFSNIVCRFGMPSVTHSDQGREFENKVMHELCLLGGSHKTKTTPYHPESDGLVERFNRTLLMMLAMFAGENKDDWDYLLPAVMMA